jgi:hypothetical protein
MTNHDNLSPADRAAIEALMVAHIATNEAIQGLVRIIAAEEGIELSPSQPTEPQPEEPRAGHRFTRIERPERGVALAEVVNDHTGTVRRFRFTKSADGSIDAEEL